ncbi:MAG: protein DoxX [Gammaproteobacteria bacterium]|nr:protein DoxX [Gammaproteobacteria bacterium]
MVQEPWLSWLLLAGRIAIAVVFLVSGVHKGIWFSKAVREYQDAKVPFLYFFLIATIALHLVAPVFIITGYFVRESAITLAVFTVVATIKVHHFWDMTGDDVLLHSRIALTNLAVLGGLLLLVAVGPGKLVL